MEKLSLVIVLLAALMIPLLMGRFKVNVFPSIVAEILVGILLGRSVLGIVEVDQYLEIFSSLGVVFLVFLSGMEIDFTLFKGKKASSQTPQNEPNPLQLAVYSYVSMLLVSLAVSLFFHFSGLFTDYWLLFIIFSSIALGIVIASLKERELLSKPFGQTVLLIAVLGEITPLVLLTVYSSVFGSGDSNLWMILLILGAAALLLRFKKVYVFFEKIDKVTTQLDIRLAFFIIFTLVMVAEGTGAESVLGAFLAGIVMKLLKPREDTVEKLDSFGYGFFIPIYFLVTGINLDLSAIFQDSKTLLLIPLFFMAFFVTRILVFPILNRQFKTKNAWAGTFLSATTLTLILPILEVAEEIGTVNDNQKGALILSAVLTCVLFPLLYNKLYVKEEEHITPILVNIIGANPLTVSIANQLKKKDYDVTLFTDNIENYQTFESDSDLVLLDDLGSDFGQIENFNSPDILVINHQDKGLQHELAIKGKAYGIERVLVHFDTNNILEDNYPELKAAAVEIFSTFDAQASLLRAMIETPSIIKIIDDTETGLYEATVNNSRFTGQAIKNLPFVQAITISKIRRGEELITPHGNTMIELGDHLIFTGNKADIGEVKRELELKN
ncbi:cation:proton antiporter domain-containing protein [Vagococcus salmoninarum]|uniref:Potassium transporter n=1 Tax=Vagococcus salmoninarum TaxID=2739 RepID=A0A429ZUT8_9ENTE|nr:cation:proton antiporter family protein [Vagococcus salmoninarum]RST97459.1 potassium transporter [Vagococcus salmoninarum]